MSAEGVPNLVQFVQSPEQKQSQGLAETYRLATQDATWTRPEQAELFADILPAGMLNVELDASISEQVPALVRVNINKNEQNQLSVGAIVGETVATVQMIPAYRKLLLEMRSTKSSSLAGLRQKLTEGEASPESTQTVQMMDVLSDQLKQVIAIEAKETGLSAMFTSEVLDKAIGAGVTVGKAALGHLPGLANAAIEIAMESSNRREDITEAVKAFPQDPAAALLRFTFPKTASALAANQQIIKNVVIARALKGEPSGDALQGLMDMVSHSAVAQLHAKVQQQVNAVMDSPLATSTMPGQKAITARGMLDIMADGAGNFLLKGLKRKK